MKLPYSHELFVDREEELKVILDIVASLLTGKLLEGQQRVIHVRGQTNLGKSWLLQECSDRLYNDPKVLPLYVNLGDLIGHSTAERFAIQLLENFDSQISSQIGRNRLFIGSNELFQLSEGLKERIKEIQKEMVLIILMDEINLISGERANLLESLEDYLLGQILDLPNLVCILAGRYPPTGWKDFNLRPQKATFHRGQSNIMHLSTFDLEKTTQQLGNHKPGSEHLVEKILDLGNGSPGNNDILLGQAKGNPLEIKDDLTAIHACNRELVEIIRNLKLPKGTSWDVWSALEALCVAQDFDRDEEMPVLLDAHSKLHGKLDWRQLDLLFDVLMDINIGPGRLIMMDPQKGTYVIDELMRASLERELMLRDQKLWRALQCAAMNMYQRWADEYNSIIFAEKADYHRERLGQAGFNPADCQVKSQEASS